MVRIVLTYIVPFLLPITVYALWILYRTRHVAQHGGKAPKFEQGPWPLMLFLGAVLSLAVLGMGAMLRGGNPGDTYVPARIENGKIVPGTIKPSE